MARNAITKEPAKTGELTTTGPGNMPDYLRERGITGSGLEGLNAQDIVIPRIKLLQGLSPELETFEAAKLGEFWLNVMDFPIGDAFDFTPILNRKRYMLMPPLVEGQKGVLARADDGKTWRPPHGEWSIRLKDVRQPVTWKITDPDVRRSGLAEFGTSNPDNPDSNPAATLFYDFLVLVHDVPDIQTPVMLSLARSAAKKGKDLQGKIMFGQGHMNARKFRATSFDDNSGGNKFKNWNFAASGWVDEDTFSAAQQYNEQFKDQNFRGAEDDEVDDDAPAGGRGSDDGKGDY